VSHKCKTAAVFSKIEMQNTSTYETEIQVGQRPVSKMTSSMICRNSFKSTVCYEYRYTWKIPREITASTWQLSHIIYKQYGYRCRCSRQIQKLVQLTISWLISLPEHQHQ